MESQLDTDKMFESQKDLVVKTVVPNLMKTLDLDTYTGRMKKNRILLLFNMPLPIFVYSCLFLNVPTACCIFLPILYRPTDFCINLPIFV